MIQIPNNVLKNTEDIIKKWMPILERILESSKLTEEQKNKICIYAESHAMIENSTISGIFPRPNTGSADRVSTLPLALKLISKLNLEGKNVQVSFTPNTEGVDTATGNSKFIDSRAYQISINLPENMDTDIVDEMLTNKMADAINIRLRSFDTIILYHLFSSMSMISEGSMPPRFYVRSRLAFNDQIEPNLILYNVVGDTLVKLDKTLDQFIQAKDEDGKKYYIDTESNTVVNVVSEEDIINDILKLETDADKIQNDIAKLRHFLSEL